jgi:hypothetical protein
MYCQSKTIWWCQFQRMFCLNRGVFVIVCGFFLQNMIWFVPQVNWCQKIIICLICSIRSIGVFWKFDWLLAQYCNELVSFNLHVIVHVEQWILHVGVSHHTNRSILMMSVSENFFLETVVFFYKIWFNLSPLFSKLWCKFFLFV